jgi:hypothetical protein
MPTVPTTPRPLAGPPSLFKPPVSNYFDQRNLGSEGVHPSFANCLYEDAVRRREEAKCRDLVETLQNEWQAETKRQVEEAVQRTRVEASITIAGLEAAAVAKNDAEIAKLYAAAAEENRRAAESIKRAHELNELGRRIEEEDEEVLADMARLRERSLERDEEGEIDIAEEELLLAEEEAILAEEAALDDDAPMEDADEAKKKNSLRFL